MLKALNRREYSKDDIDIMESLATNRQEKESPAFTEKEILERIDNIQKLEEIETLEPDRVHSDLRNKLFLFNSTKNGYARPLSMENEPTPDSSEIHELAMELAAITLKSDELVSGHEATIKDEAGFGYPPTVGTADLVLEAYDLLENDPQLAEYGAKMLSHVDKIDREPREAALLRSLEEGTSYSTELTKELSKLDDELERKETEKMRSLGKKVLYNDVTNPNYHPYDQDDINDTRLVDKSNMVFVPDELEESVHHKHDQSTEKSMAMSPDSLFDDDEEDIDIANLTKKS